MQKKILTVLLVCLCVQAPVAKPLSTGGKGLVGGIILVGLGGYGFYYFSKKLADCNQVLAIVDEQEPDRSMDYIKQLELNKRLSLVRKELERATTWYKVLKWSAAGVVVGGLGVSSYGLWKLAQSDEEDDDSDPNKDKDKDKDKKDKKKREKLVEMLVERQKMENELLQAVAKRTARRAAAGLGPVDVKRKKTNFGRKTQNPVFVFGLDLMKNRRSQLYPDDPDSDDEEDDEQEDEEEQANGENEEE